MELRSWGPHSLRDGITSHSHTLDHTPLNHTVLTVPFPSGFFVHIDFPSEKAPQPQRSLSGSHRVPESSGPIFILSLAVVLALVWCLIGSTGSQSCQAAEISRASPDRRGHPWTPNSDHIGVTMIVINDQSEIQINKCERFYFCDQNTVLKNPQPKRQCRARDWCWVNLDPTSIAPDLPLFTHATSSEAILYSFFCLRQRCPDFFCNPAYI